MQSTDRPDPAITPTAFDASDGGATVQSAPTNALLAAALLALAALASDPALSTALAPDVLTHLRAAGEAQRASEKARTDAHEAALAHVADSEAQAEALEAELSRTRLALATAQTDTAALRHMLAERDAEDAAMAARIAAMATAMVGVGDRLATRRAVDAGAADNATEAKPRTNDATGTNRGDFDGAAVSAPRTVCGAAGTSGNSVLASCGKRRIGKG